MEVNGIHRLHGGKHGLRQSLNRWIEIAVVGGADGVVGPVIVAVVPIDATGDVSPDVAVGVLHFEEIPIAPAELLFERRETGTSQIPAGAEMAGQGEKTEGIHHGCAHPFAQVAGIVPAAGGVDVRAVVAAARVVEMTSRMHVRHGDSAALRAMVAGDDGEKPAPGIAPDEEGRRQLGPHMNLIHTFARDGGEVAGHGRPQAGSRRR